MDTAVMIESDLDPIEEIRLRTWARQNYLPRELRDNSWHPIILEEMLRKEKEQSHASQ
ncbi:hypothetical protein [Thalassoglobus sp.]|uniref:hypothetical protein n=1 Tax=Thalassoglobus sp. TaxID=2795869 RepID=UPI003AA9DA8D